MSGAAAGNTAILARAAPAPAVSLLPASAPSVPLYIFIYDRRFSAARAFGAAADQARSTGGTVAIDGDITELWSRDLRLRWSTGEGAIAGMTTDRTLFCLEQLAKDQWMRVVFRAEHTIAGGDDSAHRLSGSAPMLARIAPLLAARDWPAKMPAVLASCSIPQGADRTGGAASVTCSLGLPSARRRRIADENLVSFVIA
jgi:hypothetical protein